MKNILFSISAASLLMACSTIIDHQTQKVTVLTPGTVNAKCTLQNRDMKYVAYTGQEIEIMKSPNDLVVNCLAPGNREKTVLVKREINGWVFANVANGFVPGLAYDYFSRGGFDYPDEIEVSFLGEPIKEYPMPKYMSEDLDMNHQYNKFEYMGPTTVMTEADKNSGSEPLEKKEITSYDDPAPMQTSEPVMAQEGYNLDNIHRQYNPTVPYDPTEEDK